MDGWMDGWMNGWMDGWMDGWMGSTIGGHMDQRQVQLEDGATCCLSHLCLPGSSGVFDLLDPDLLWCVPLGLQACRHRVLDAQLPNLSVLQRTALSRKTQTLYPRTDLPPQPALSICY
ncbi:hypothetical protein CRENBAI_003718, partial [Crenichthys baileyi]